MHSVPRPGEALPRRLRSMEQSIKSFAGFRRAATMKIAELERRIEALEAERGELTTSSPVESEED